MVNLGQHTQGTAQVTLKPGKYAIGETQAGAFTGSVLAKSDSLSQRTARTIHVTAAFTPKRH